jgi:flagellar hook-basal body complex protein FliE
MSDLTVNGVRGAAIPMPSVPIPTAGRAAGGFGETLERALAGVNSLQLDAEAGAAALASGQPVDTAKTLVTIEKASIAFQFAMQVRNKLLEAYQEVMRMQV